MEIRGWQKTGRKGSLDVRSTTSPESPGHNTGGLAFWFIRAERYRHEQGVKFMTVQERCQHANHRLCEDHRAASRIRRRKCLNRVKSS